MTGSNPHEAQPSMPIVLNAVTTRTVGFVAHGVRVLSVGATAPGALLRLLRGQQCSVTVVTEANENLDCDKLVRGRIEQESVRQQLGSERFDVVIVGDALMHATDPAAILRSVEPFLSDEGYIVAAFPGPAAGDAPVEPLAGGFSGNYLDTQARLDELMGNCGLAIGRVDPLPSYFVVAAFPLPEARLRMTRETMQALIRRSETAEHEARTLAGTKSDLERQIATCQKQREIREESLHAARERAVRQQELIDVLQGQIQQQRADAANRQAVIDRLQGALEQHRIDLSREIDASRAARRHVEQMARSYSWIVTAPLRAVGRRLGMGPR